MTQIIDVSHFDTIAFGNIRRPLGSKRKHVFGIITLNKIYVTCHSLFWTMHCIVEKVENALSCILLAIKLALSDYYQAQYSSENLLFLLHMLCSVFSMPANVKSAVCTQ